MKHNIACDDVFEILTRAPFPTGDSIDRDVERHLSLCHECRQLAEALRPATGLFSEVMSAEEQQALPAYRGQATIVMNRISSDVATRAAAETAPHRIGNVKSGLIPAIGLALLLMIAVTQGPGAAKNAQQDHSSSPLIPLVTSSHECLMAGLTLPAGCVPLSAVGPLRDDHETARDAIPYARGESEPYAQHLHSLMVCQSCHETSKAVEHRQACCTNCHQANIENGSSQPPVPRLVAACSTCHM